jgi:hypothetical protein
MVDAPQALLAETTAPPMSDYVDQQQMWADITGRLHRWSWTKGYGGGLFGAQVARERDGQISYRALLLTISALPQLDWSLEELDYPESIEAMFQAVHQRARDVGYLSGYPSFTWNGTSLRCVMIDATAAELVEIPAVKLR